MKTEEKVDKNIVNNKKNIWGKLLIIVIVLLSFSIGLISQTTDRIGYSKNSNSSVDIALKVRQDDLGAFLLAKLNIFDATQLDTKRIIAPGTYGKYTLLVENLTNKDLVYNLQLSEINNNNLKIKYKLKIENICLSGKEDEWKNANEIKVNNISIAPQESIYYTIYWTWIGDEGEIAKKEENESLEYTLGVGLYAQ